MLPAGKHHCKEESETLCGFTPKGGPTNYWDHLYRVHRGEFLALKREDGKLLPNGEKNLVDLEDAFKKAHASEAEVVVMLAPEAKATMDQVVATWIVDDDQPKLAASTTAFKEMMKAMTNGSYEGCCHQTVSQYIAMLESEGRDICRKFVEATLKQGTKPVISSDLWSKNGLALFGLLVHGIDEDWKMRELLAGAVPCSECRHTGAIIAKMNDDALKVVGMLDPPEQTFRAKTDNASNMITAYSNLPHDPCCCHTIELSANKFVEHAGIISVVAKGRGLVGYFRSSTIGTSHLNELQEILALAQGKLTQDVKVAKPYYYL